MKRTIATTVCFCLTFCLSIGLSTFFGTSTRGGEPLEKASISFRVSEAVWSDDARFNQMLELFDRHPGATDEITFFTQTTHAPIADEELERRCEILKERIAEVHKHGLRSGINVLCTLGHHPEDMSQVIGPEYPRAQTIDGVVAQATLCVNNDIFRDRIRRIYGAVARTGADYVWIDDDVRTGHWLDSVGNSGSFCFCDACMALLSEKFGKATTREELKEKLGDPLTLTVIRQFASDSYDKMFALIEEVVHEVDPKIALGFMTGERYDEGYDFTRWAKTLEGPDGDKEVYWRPGGGFYDQYWMAGLFDKTQQIGRQIALLPPEVKVIQSEIENFPYQPLKKSAAITTLEAVSHIGAGCTGAAFNVLTMNEEPLDEYERFMTAIAKRRPFMDVAVQKLGRAPNVGVLPLWNKNDGNYTNRTPVQTLTAGIMETGIPVAFDYTQPADVLLLSRNYLDHLRPEDAKELFKKGVYLDNDALGLANDPGTYALNDLTGMEYGGVITVDGIEKFTSHPLNGRFGGRTRDLRQSFWRDPIFALHLTRPGVEILSSCVNYEGETQAEAIVGIFENSLGGRVCVNGYYPWSNFYNYPKQAQIRAIMRWLSKDRLPGYVESFGQIHLSLRKPDENGRFAGIAINANYDAEENVAIRLKTEKDAITVYDYDCEKRVVSASDVDDAGYKLFVIPEIKAWEAALIVVE